MSRSPSRNVARRTGGRSARTARAASIRWSNCCRDASPRASWSGSAGSMAACFRGRRISAFPAVARTMRRCASTWRRCCTALARGSTHKPELLFRLRAVDETDLVVHIDAALPMSKQGPAAGRVLETDDVSALFGLDMAVPAVPATGKPSGKPRTGRARRTAPVPEGGASAANAAVPRTAGPQRASAGIPPASPALTNTATAAKKGAAKPDIPKRESAAAKATPTKRLAAKQAVTAKASARPVAPEKAVAAAEVQGERQKALDTRGRSGAHRRTKKGASVATPDVLQVPARGRGRPPGSKNKAATVRKPIQKPVKWW